MFARSAALLLVLASACAAQPPVDESGTSSSSTTDEPSSSGEPDSTSSSGDETTGDESSGAPSSSGTSGEDSSGGSSGPVGFCGDGEVGPGEQCDDGIETKLCDKDCSLQQCGDGYVNNTAVEQCDDGNALNTDSCRNACRLAVCGDGYVWIGEEECDDGNDVAGDGCSSCSWERWDVAGVSHDVALADLHRWKPCWSDTYLDGGKVTDLLFACKEKRLLLGCMKNGDAALAVAAQGLRSDVLFVPEVNYQKGERHLANGVAWYFAPSTGMVGFGPDDGQVEPCEKPGQKDQMCWPTGGDMLTFSMGFRCGAVTLTDEESAKWVRVAYQAGD